MSLKLYITFIGVLNLFCVTNGQQMLKILNPGVQENSNTQAQYIAGTTTEAMMMDVGNNFQRADRICVFGIWALYNNTNYGIGQESSTTVISVVGKSSAKLECSGSGQIAGLRNVKSLRFFGASDGMSPGIAILSEAFLLGGKWPATSSAMPPALMDPTGVRLGSLAITGPNTFWQLCADPACNFKICVNVFRGPFAATFFLVRDAVRDTASKWPLVINNVQQITQAECDGMANPNYGSRSLLWRNENNSSLDSTLDFHIHTPSQGATIENYYSDSDSPAQTII